MKRKEVETKEDRRRGRKGDRDQPGGRKKDLMRNEHGEDEDDEKRNSAVDRAVRKTRSRHLDG